MHQLISKSWHVRLGLTSMEEFELKAQTSGDGRGLRLGSDSLIIDDDQRMCEPINYWCKHSHAKQECFEYAFKYVCLSGKSLESHAWRCLMLTALGTEAFPLWWNMGIVCSLSLDSVQRIALGLPQFITLVSIARLFCTCLALLFAHLHPDGFGGSMQPFGRWNWVTHSDLSPLLCCSRSTGKCSCRPSDMIRPAFPYISQWVLPWRWQVFVSLYLTWSKTPKFGFNSCTSRQLFETSRGSRITQTEGNNKHRCNDVLYDHVVSCVQQMGIKDESSNFTVDLNHAKTQKL